MAIPFPWAKDNHQFYNSKHLSDENLCWLMNQQDFQLTNTKNFLNLKFNKATVSDYFKSMIAQIGENLILNDLLVYENENFSFSQKHR